MLSVLLVLVLVALLSLIPAGQVTAQTFTTLHSFMATSHPGYGDGTNSDGAAPYAGLIANSLGSTLYGTANQGGSSGAGTVFSVHSDGTGFTNLHSFMAAYDPPYTNSDGAYPNDGLILSGNTLYGTLGGGGSSSYGTVFAVNTDGSGFTNLHTFTLSEGALPEAGLILSGNTLYGTAYQGGSSGGGTVFKLNADGVGFTTLHRFTAVVYDPTLQALTNSDGSSPYGGLILSGNTLYGTTIGGGSSGNGTVFAVNTNGTGFATLYSFTAFSSPFSPTNSDGAVPYAGLVLSGDTLYGSAANGGSLGNGTLFALNTNGTGFTTLHSFTGGGDGVVPYAGLLLSGNTLYGMTHFGGGSGAGTVFTVNTDGTGFTNLYSFTGGSDGGYPSAALILAGGSLYGTAIGGGSSGSGTVFSLSFRPQLTIAVSGTNVILSWPNSYAGFRYSGYYLQETEDLGSAGGWISVPDTNLPVIVDGQIKVTRPMLSPQISYRLVQ